MTGFERQPTLWGHFQRSRCLICQGKSVEVPQTALGDAALDRWEPRHAQLHAQEDDAA